MSRTTSAAVRAILGENYDTLLVPSLVGFIESASSLVDDVVTCMSDNGDTAHSAAKLELIERWLSGHFYHCSDPTYTTKSTGGGSGGFMGNGTSGLDGSRYGQMAVRLDSSRCLGSLDKGGVAEMAWIGKPYSEQIAYQDRD